MIEKLKEPKKEFIELKILRKLSLEELNTISGGKMNKKLTKATATILSVLTLSTVAVPELSAAYPNNSASKPLNLKFKRNRNKEVTKKNISPQIEQVLPIVSVASFLATFITIEATALTTLYNSPNIYLGNMGKFVSYPKNAKEVDNQLYTLVFTSVFKPIMTLQLTDEACIENFCPLFIEYIYKIYIEGHVDKKIILEGLAKFYKRDECGGNLARLTKIMYYILMKCDYDANKQILENAKKDTNYLLKSNSIKIPKVNGKIATYITIDIPDYIKSSAYKETCIGSASTKTSYGYYTHELLDETSAAIIVQKLKESNDKTGIKVVEQLVNGEEESYDLKDADLEVSDNTIQLNHKHFLSKIKLKWPEKNSKNIWCNFTEGGEKAMNNNYKYCYVNNDLDIVLYSKNSDPNSFKDYNWVTKYFFKKSKIKGGKKKQHWYSFSTKNHIDDDLLEFLRDTSSAHSK